MHCDDRGINILALIGQYFMDGFVDFKRQVLNEVEFSVLAKDLNILDNLKIAHRIFEIIRFNAFMRIFKVRVNTKTDALRIIFFCLTISQVNPNSYI